MQDPVRDEDLRAPVSHSDLVLLTQSARPWLQQLENALRERGLGVKQVPAAGLAFDAFVHGAGAVILEPAPAMSVAEQWLALCERASRVLPASFVLLDPAQALQEEAWLSAGFDEVVVGDVPVQPLAGRIVARMASRHVRHSLGAVDRLTGLPTHTAFFERLDPTIRLSSRASMPMAVAVLDLDGFRDLEKQVGRPLARRVLADVVRYLQENLRRSDLVARLGDDRFGLILNHITAFEARRLLYKLWKRLQLAPATVEALKGTPLAGLAQGRATFTAGIAVFPGDSCDPYELYTRAEIALDVARATGQRRILLFAETSGDSGSDRHSTDLRYHRVNDPSRDDPE